MAAEMNLQSHWADPVDLSAPLVIDCDELKNSDTGCAVARLVRDENRIEWLGGVPSELLERVASERKKYDGWANYKREKIASTWEPLDPATRTMAW